MAKMRSLAPWFIITVGGLFVVFMILSDSKLDQVIGLRSNNVGSIDGIEISYPQFAQAVDNYEKQLAAQQGREVDPNRRPMIRNQVWDQFITQRVLENKIEEYGIVVTDEEIYDAIMGDNPPEYLKRDFVDSTGNFNRTLYETALKDPRNKQLLISIEEGIREEKKREKLMDYLTASINVTDEEVKENFLRRNTEMAAEFVRVSTNSVNDSAITYNDSDLKDYYNKNKESYKIHESRKIKYVFFRKEASAADTNYVKENMFDHKKKLTAEPGNFKTYVEIYSNKPYSVDTLSISQLPTQSVDALVKADKNNVVGPVLTREGYILYNLLDKTKSQLQVKASHILIKGSDAKAKKEANDIYNQLKSGADFEELAKAKSQDGSASRGGDLGWFQEGRMVEDFWKACKKAKVNKVTRPVKTQFGYHIIKVTEKTSKAFVVEQIVNKIEVSGTTTDRLHEKANDFSFLADKYGFDKEVEELKYTAIESMQFAEASGFVPGIGYNMALVKFAFENGIGSISPAFTVNGNYVVATVTEEIAEGYRSFEESKGSIKSAVIREKKIAKAVELAELIKKGIEGSGNMDDAKVVFPQAFVTTVEKFDGMNTIVGIGREAAVSEAALTAELNKVSGPVQGNMGAYLIKVTSRTPFDETNFNVQKGGLKTQLVSSKKNNYFREWLAQAKKEIDVEDNRYQFFR
ncbi:MAG: peptidylprolyl isomerase [Rhodothermaceae bacterium]